MEYVDCLGRTRTCLRKDLEYLKSKDSDLRSSIDVKDDETVDTNETKVCDTPNKDEEVNDGLTEKNELLSSDMRRECLRQQWEKEEEVLMNKSNIHYQDVLFSGRFKYFCGKSQVYFFNIILEARTHGVGYYGFSKDEEERAQQQEALRKLRDETQQQQKKAENLRALREKQLAARAKAARNRKRARMGLPPEEDGQLVLNFFC